MKINLSAFWNNSKDTVLRFPATIAFLAALTILMIENIILEKSPDWLTFFFCVGMLLTLLLHICTEEREEYGLSNVFKKPKAALLWLGSIAVLAADAYSLHLKAYSCYRYPCRTHHAWRLVPAVYGFCSAIRF